MVSYEEALKKAKSLKHDVETCGEYEGGYVFMSREDECSIGGGSGPCCIIKSSGRAVDMLTFIDNHPGEWIRNFDV